MWCGAVMYGDIFTPWQRFSAGGSAVGLVRTYLAVAIGFREYVLLGSSRYRQIDIVRTGSHGLIGG